MTYYEDDAREMEASTVDSNGDFDVSVDVTERDGGWEVLAVDYENQTIVDRRNDVFCSWVEAMRAAERYQTEFGIEHAEFVPLY